MLRAFPPAPRRRDAAASVEFAIASLVFFTLFMGLVDFGRGLMTSYGLVNAARRAARVAVVPGRANTNVTAAVTDALGRAGIPSAGATTTVKVNSTTADASTAKPGDRITVTVAIPVTSVTWLPMSRWVTAPSAGGTPSAASDPLPPEGPFVCVSAPSPAAEPLPPWSSWRCCRRSWYRCSSACSRSAAASW